MSNKRASDGAAAGSEGMQLSKRARVENEEDASMQQIVVSQDARGKGLVQSVKRTSGLMAPIMNLAGHTAEILDARFDPSGERLASTSKDRSILLWNVYGECLNYGVLRPSTPRTVFTTIQFSPVAGSPHFFAGASDGVLSTFDLKTGDIVRKHRPPISRVLNAVDCVRGTGRELLLGAGDDGVARIWTVDSKEAIEEIDLGYPVTAAKWSLDGQQVFLGGIDNDIHCFDLRKKQVVYSLRGHTDTISGLSVSPSGSHLLSSSFDNTVRIWDIKPFAPVQQPGQLTSPRLHRTLMGAPAGFDSQLRKPAWDPSGDRVAVGAADRSVIIWDVETAQIRYKLPGHRGTVVAVEFSPKSDEPIIMSAGLDAQIVESFPTALGRLSSADVLSSFFHVQSFSAKVSLNITLYYPRSFV